MAVPVGSPNGHDLLATPGGGGTGTDSIAPRSRARASYLLRPLLSYALRTILVSGRRQQNFALPTEDEIETVQNTEGRTWHLLHENMLEYPSKEGLHESQPVLG
jgi:hypothetical protein